MSYFLCLTKSMEITAVRRKKHTKCAVPAGANFLQSGKFQKDLVLLVGSCSLWGLLRGLQNLEAPLVIGFNFVRAKPPLRRAESRFGKPRTSRKGTVLFFSLVRKERGVPQRFANLWTPGSDSKLCRRKFQQSFPTARAETGFSHKTAAKRL